MSESNEFLTELATSPYGPFLGEFSWGNWMADGSSRGLTPEVSPRPGPVSPEPRPLPLDYSSRFSAAREPPGV